MSERDIIFIRKPLPRDIVIEVARKHELTLADLTGESKKRYIAHARQEAMWTLRQRTRLSLPQIARHLNRKDHTTAWHGIRAHEARRAADSLAEAQERAVA